jgi:hypothetical protein
MVKVLLPAISSVILTLVIPGAKITVSIIVHNVGSTDFAPFAQRYGHVLTIDYFLAFLPLAIGIPYA